MCACVHVWLPGWHLVSDFSQPASNELANFVISRKSLGHTALGRLLRMPFGFCPEIQKTLGHTALGWLLRMHFGVFGTIQVTSRIF